MKYNMDNLPKLPSNDTCIKPLPVTEACFNTPIPSQKSVILYIYKTFFHMDPPLPSTTSLKLIKLRERQDKIWGDKFVFNNNEMLFPQDSSTNNPDFTNQDCTSNSWFVGKRLSQKWREHTIISNNTYSSQIHKSHKLVSIQ